MAEQQEGEKPDPYVDWLAMEKTMEMERNRALAERDGWKEIAQMLMAAALDTDVEELSTETMPPVEVVSAWTKDSGPLSMPYTAKVKEWWQDMLAHHSEDQRLRRAVSRLQRHINLFHFVERILAEYRPEHNQDERFNQMIRELQDLYTKTTNHSEP